MRGSRTEYITYNRRITLRNTVGSLISLQARMVRHALRKKPNYAVLDRQQQRFDAAIEKLIDLHRGIPDANTAH